MKTYTFKKERNGGFPRNAFGDGWEMAVKFAAGDKYAEFVSSCGKCDFRHGKHYDTKQNASPILYGEVKRGNTYIHGSSRVIYATHIAYEIINETETEVEIFIDLGNTDFWVVDKKAFVKFLLSTPGMVRDIPARSQMNIQTIWNYSKNKYHGVKYKVLEKWLDENKLDDDIVDIILDGFYSRMA